VVADHQDWLVVTLAPLDVDDPVDVEDPLEADDPLVGSLPAEPVVDEVDGVVVLAALVRCDALVEVVLPR
jgi:hypothetical protein